MYEKCIINPEHDCIIYTKAKEIEADLNDLRRQNAASHERIFDRIGELEKQNSIQKIQYDNLLEKLGSIADSIKEIESNNKALISKIPSITQNTESIERISEEVAEISKKPAKRWESIVDKIIMILVAAIMGFFTSRLGL